MERAKIKNVIIVILLIVNIVFAVLLIREAAGTKKIKDTVLSDLHTVLENNGISLNTVYIPLSEGVYTLTAARSPEKEAQMAKTLIGDYTMEDQGGNIHYYYGAGGEAYFRGSGDFEIELAAKTDDSAKAISEQFSANGFDIDVPSGGSGTADCRQTINGMRILNCTISVSYEGGMPVSLAGRWLLSDASALTDQPAIDVSTALIRFIAGLNKNGFICTEISGLELGYYMTAHVTGQFELVPMWSISTDTGEYYVNAISGELEKR